MFYAAAQTHTLSHTHRHTRVAPTHMSAACEEPTKRGAQEQQRAAEGAAAGPSQGPKSRVEEQQLQRGLPGLPGWAASGVVVLVLHAIISWHWLFLQPLSCILRPAIN